MNYKIVLILWSIFAVSVIYWDQHRWDEPIPLSKCHNAQIKIYHDRPMCMECKKFCELKEKNGK
jgi:hypothetical protein